MSKQNLKDVAATQTAELTEFHTEMTQKIDKLAENIRFIKHKEHLNEMVNDVKDVWAALLKQMIGILAKFVTGRERNLQKHAKPVKVRDGF